jgi:hypothetical protein
LFWYQPKALLTFLHNLVIELSNRVRKDNNTNTELGNDRQPQLYNLAKDMGEKNNMAAVNLEKVRELEGLLKR